jgi:hypothetical protein
MQNHIILFSFMSFLMLTFSCNANPAKENIPSHNSEFQANWCAEKGFDEIVSTKVDSLKFYSIAGNLLENFNETESISGLFLDVAKSFLGTPYVANTLEANDTEKLVINLQGVDCVTFVEYSLAIAIALKRGSGSIEDFARFLTCIRYRDGIIDGYPSRLHYFTEWFFVKEQVGLLQMVNTLPGCQPHNSKVGFMTSRPHLYKQLQNYAFLEEMARIEKEITHIEMNYIPKEKIQSVESKINDGDIIAFVTTIEGLDVSHTGIAIHQGKKLHLLHASSKSNRVEISPLPLSEYIATSRNVKGVLVGRLIL